jgi:UDP-GlcNAc3NAcA epimerase
LPKPDFNLGVGSGTPGFQIGEMLKRLQKVFDRDKKFDIVIVYGDTNSTLAGALCAERSGIRVAHVEAGLRSFDRRMPEETNRILTDHISDLLFAPTTTALENLRRENVSGRIIYTGDVSVEIVRHAVKKLMASPESHLLERLQLGKYHYDRDSYFLMTIHRAENTNSEKSMISLIRACEILAEKIVDTKIIFPIHPRTVNFLKHMNLYDRLKKCRAVRLIRPVGYIDFIALMRRATKIVTDSGGVQKEAYLLGIPCITVRKSTEWVETVEAGGNVLTDTDTYEIVKTVKDWNPTSRVFRKNIFGNGKSSERIKDSLMKLKL